MKEALRLGDKTFPHGALYIPNDPAAVPILEGAARDFGLVFTPVDLRPAGEALKLRPVRLGVWDQYGGSMSSGWMQWVLDQYEFPYEKVYAPALDAGDLRRKFDVLVFVSGAIPAPPAEGRMTGDFGGRGGQMPQADVPEEFKFMVGRITAEKTIPHILRFLEDGGTILTIGSSTGLAGHLKLPIASHLMEKTEDGRETPVSRQKYYVPGSILAARVDPTHPLAYGMSENTDVFFDNSPVFDLSPDASLRGLRPVAWFENKNPLRSGWVWGEQYLRRGIEVIEAPVGKGKLFLCGPEIVFRGQPHGTFKLVFNGIFYGPAESVKTN